MNCKHIYCKNRGKKSQAVGENTNLMLQWGGSCNWVESAISPTFLLWSWEVFRWESASQKWKKYLMPDTIFGLISPLSFLPPPFACFSLNTLLSYHIPLGLSPLKITFNLLPFKLLVESLERGNAKYHPEMGLGGSHGHEEASKPTASLIFFL